MFERLFSWLPEDFDSSGGEESIDVSHAKQLRDPKIRDSAGVRQEPVGPPRLQDASWPCIENLDELMASSKERRLRSNTSKDLVDVETQLNAEENSANTHNLQ